MDFVASPTSTLAEDAAPARSPSVIPRKPVPPPQTQVDDRPPNEPVEAPKPPVVKHLQVPDIRAPFGQAY